MNKSLILNYILKNGKINHFCLNKKWYTNKNIIHIYDLIFTETDFLNKLDSVSLRERIFYIQNNLTEINKCPYCENRTGFDACILKFKKTCGNKKCISENKSEILKKMMSDENYKNERCYEMIAAAIKRGNDIKGKTLIEIHGQELGERLSSINKSNLSKINRDENIINKKIINRKNNGNPWHSNDTISKISISNSKTHNSEEYRNSRKEIDISVGKKMSKIMKEKILNGEFTPPITNSWTHWKSFIKMDDGTIKKFRSNWDAVFWLINKNNVEYEKLRIQYKFNNETKIYIVDFYDEKNNIAYEIKPTSLKCKNQNIEKEKYLIEYCKQHNIGYKCISDDWFMENIKHVNFDIHPQLKKSFKKFI